MIVHGGTPNQVIRSVIEDHKVNPIAIKPLKYPCSPESFDDLLRRAPNGTLLDTIQRETTPDGGILRRGFYAWQLNRFLAAGYARQQLHVLLTEELFQDFVGVVHGLESFLGLPFFNYTPLAVKNDRGFTVLRNMHSKADNLQYAPMMPATRAILDAFYGPSMLPLTSFVEPARLEKFWGVQVSQRGDRASGHYDQDYGEGDDDEAQGGSDDDNDDGSDDDDDLSRAE